MLAGTESELNSMYLNDLVFSSDINVSESEM